MFLPISGVVWVKLRDSLTGHSVGRCASTVRTADSTSGAVLRHWPEAGPPLGIPRKLKRINEIAAELNPILFPRK